MAKREIPDTVVNHDVRTYLGQLAEHIEVLEKTHKTLCELAANKTMTPEEKKALETIITARNNLDSQWRQLTPTIHEAILTGRFVITKK